MAAAAAVSVRSELIASACSRTPHALDWHSDSLIAYGVGSSVALYDPTDEHARGIHATLQGHKSRVNCVRFVRSVSGERQDTIVSASADCTARMWRRTAGPDTSQWECVAVLEGHGNAVISVASVELEDGRVVAVTASTDGTLRVFEHHEGSTHSVQVIDVGARNAVDVALTALPGCGGIVLATGNTDNCVHLFTRAQADRAQFAKALKLAGHEDWVTALSFYRHQASEASRHNSTIAHWQTGDVVLASASQDKYIRLWRISPAATSAGGSSASTDGADADKKAAQAMLDAFSASLGSDAGGAQLSTRAHVMCVAGGGGGRYAVSLDSVLVGHDGWVHSVAWSGGPALVSASADSSVIVWAADADAGVWSSVARLGEAGGAVLGLLGAAMSPSGRMVVAHGYQGSLHMWRRGGDAGGWQPRFSVSGHYGSVQDVCWDPLGNYVLSVSADQTARLFAPLALAPAGTAWREIARPQIHGYDMRCAAFVSPFAYVSGADEKVLRVFRATQQFSASWRALARPANAVADAELDGLAVGASLPVLGLSNKAVEEDRVRALNESDIAQLNDSYQVRQTHVDVVANAAILARSAAAGADVPEPPLEELLLRHTLWPEVDKLYAHPYEIFAVAAAHRGDWIATACKAASERHAAIRLYSTRTWQPPMVRTNGEPPAAASPLMAHSLTVTRMRFSPPASAGGPADRHLLSVSRDRSWALHERTPPAGLDDDVFDAPTGPYRLIRHQVKAHARIIWDAAWSPDARFFATASRDKTVKLWPCPQGPDDSAAPVVLSFPDAVTAIDFLPTQIRDDGQQALDHHAAPKYVLAAALESGRVFVLTAAALASGAMPATWESFEIPRAHTHVAMVHRLAWRPHPELPAVTVCSKDRDWLLASASDDQTVRIIAVNL
ncbi:Elongator subunit elp2 [Coemansia sp. RSA 2320]|nr:Elongator subunit elp2 [Coemansia sp. RSA 2320]